MTSRAGIRVVPQASVPGHPDGDPAMLCAQDLVVDLDAHLVLVGDRVITMPRKELDILAVLVGAVGRVVSRQELIERVWGPHGAPAKSLDVHIRRLRGRIEPDSHHPRYIRTVRGFGYIFDTIVPSHGGLWPGSPSSSPPSSPHGSPPKSSPPGGTMGDEVRRAC